MSEPEQSIFLVSPAQKNNTNTNSIQEHEPIQSHILLRKQNAYIKSTDPKEVLIRIRHIMQLYHLKQKDIAEELNWSNSRLSQVLLHKYSHKLQDRVKQLGELCYQKDLSLILSIRSYAISNSISPKQISDEIQIDSNKFLQWLYFSLPLTERITIDEPLLEWCDKHFNSTHIVTHRVDTLPSSNNNNNNNLRNDKKRPMTLPYAEQKQQQQQLTNSNSNNHEHVSKYMRTENSTDAKSHSHSNDVNNNNNNNIYHDDNDDSNNKINSDSTNSSVSVIDADLDLGIHNQSDNNVFDFLSGDTSDIDDSEVMC